MKVNFKCDLDLEKWVNKYDYVLKINKCVKEYSRYCLIIIILCSITILLSK